MNFSTTSADETIYLFKRILPALVAALSSALKIAKPSKPISVAYRPGPGQFLPLYEPAQEKYLSHIG
jgi:hypothetical protein